MNILIPFVFKILGEIDSVIDSVMGWAVVVWEVVAGEVVVGEMTVGEVCFVFSASGIRSGITGRMKNRKSILKYIQLKTRNKNLSWGSGNKYKILLLHRY